MKKLSRDQLTGAGDAGVYLPYRQFIAKLAVGEGGRASVEEEGVSRQTIKARITSAASAADVKIKFHRTSGDEVIFEVVSAPDRPRRGRPPKS